MKFFGFDDAEDDYDGNDDYEERKEERRKRPRRDNSHQLPGPAAGKLILFKGIADDNDKRKLCDAFNDGAMILIDLHNLSQREFDERGERFITFMGGIAYARKGELQYIEPAQYLITPKEGMFETWSEESEHE